MTGDLVERLRFWAAGGPPEGDLMVAAADRIAQLAGGTLWLTQWGGLAPHNLTGDCDNVACYDVHRAATEALGELT